MALTRRTLLTAGGAGAALLAVGGVGLGLRPSVLRPAPSGLSVLDPTAYSVLAAVADRVAPGDDVLPPASELGVAAAVDALLATMDPLAAQELVQALHLLENALAGFLLDGRTTTFTAASPAEQDRVLEAWRTSGIAVRRKAFKALRGLCASAYFANPATYAACGYPGPPDYRGLRAADAIPDPAAPAGDPEEVP